MRTMSIPNTYEISYADDRDLTSESVSTLCDVIVLAHNQEFYKNLTLDSKLCQLTGISETDLHLIKQGASSKFTSSNNDTCTSIEFSLLHKSSGIRRFIIALLPSPQCSRHNTYTRSHAITSFIKANKGSTGSASSPNRLMIYLFTKDSSFIVGQACAISRCFPVFSMKTSPAPKKKITSDSNGDSDVVSNDTNVVAATTDHFHLIIENDNSIASPLLATATVPIPPTLKSDLENLFDGIQLAQRLVDTPPNILSTSRYVAEVQQIIQTLKDQQHERLQLELQGILNITKSPSLPTILSATASTADIKIHTYLSGEELEKEGFGGIYHVGKAAAADSPPVFLCLSYIPAGLENHPPVTLVGKGIVYDTGGLSIKTPTTSMAGMKTDMGGSAAVLGAFQAIVQSRLHTPVYAMLCIAENSVAGNAIRPDDVITMLSGKTVEVNNTDAEGRLVLADGVYFASKYLTTTTTTTSASSTSATPTSTSEETKEETSSPTETASPTPSTSTLIPSVIIDIATLTGAQGVATGRNHAGIYCNDEVLEQKAIQAGKYTGDLVFPLPYCPEFYKNEFRSVVADMKNSVADRTNAQSSCAAQFIGNHIEDYLNKQGGKWLHIDMAYPCNVSERATGYGVALLYELVKSYQVVKGSSVTATTGSTAISAVDTTTTTAVIVSQPTALTAATAV